MTAFLTLVDLFATQALLPALAQAYSVSPAAMGVAVNACTLGMAVSSLAVALLGSRIERRRGIWISLALLAAPTLSLSVAPNLLTFAALRVAQGIFMAAAFALMLAYLGEHLSARSSASAFAAYVTGNVASNLLGRLFASAVADHFGLAASFWVFALLNLSGALLVYCTVPPTMPAAACRREASRAAWTDHLRNRPLLAGFGIGFCILFAFIGTFTYVNFVLAAAPFQLGMMSLGFVYLVFLPSIATTPLGGRAVARFGTRTTLWSALAIAAAGLPLLLMPALAAVMTGLALIGIGTFLAQAAATGFIGGAAPTEPRAGQRAVSGELFPRRTHRQRCPGAALRRARLAGVCRWHRHRAHHRRAVDHGPAPEDSTRRRTCGRGMEPIGSRQWPPRRASARSSHQHRFLLEAAMNIMTRRSEPSRPSGQIVLVLQGGGAFGAYQAGVYQGLSEAGIEPDWVIGTSIGAINAALIAGNKPADRLDRLKDFWDRVCTRSSLKASWLSMFGNAFANLGVLTQGVPGFFQPNPSALWGMHYAAGPGLAAYYGTDPLKSTLADLIDVEHSTARRCVRPSAR